MFKIRREPVAPDLEKINVVKICLDQYSLFPIKLNMISEEILNNVRLIGNRSYKDFDFSSIKAEDIKFSMSQYYDEVEIYAECSVPYSEWARRDLTEKYEAKLASYQKWERENDDQIEAELARREKASQEREAQEVIDARFVIEGLEKKLAKAKRKLKSLEK